MNQTKFILHGGNTGSNNQFNNDFFKQIAESGNKILLCYFARDLQKWDELAKEDGEKIAGFNPNAEFQTASLEKFDEQLNWCDVLYLRGGETSDLMKRLTKSENWFKSVYGKTVVGSSAGVYVLSDYYFGNDFKKIEEGLGILKFKSLCHFVEGEDQYLVEALSQVGNKDSEILVLPDYRSVTFYSPSRNAPCVSKEKDSDST